MDDGNGQRPGPPDDRPATPPGDDVGGRRRSPPALVTSVVFGVIGTVLLVVGLVGGSEPLVLSAVGAGTISLVAVLVWREQLIAAWRRERRVGP